MSLRSLVRFAIPIAAGVALGPGAAAASAATTWNVTSTADGPAAGGNCPSASNCSLRDAIADAHDGDTISVPAGHITLNQGALQIDASITITGAGAGSTTIDGDNASRVISVIGPPPAFAESDATLTLQDLTVTGGSVTRPSAGSDAGGAGIQVNSSGGLILNGVTVTDNTFNATASTTSSSGYDIGGAGVMSLSTVDIVDSTISHNVLTLANAQSQSGGGGLLVTEGEAILAGTTISDNTANITEGTNDIGDNGGGGAFIANGVGDLIIEHSTIAGNALSLQGTQLGFDDGGGGLAFEGHTIQATASTFSGNSTDLGHNTQADGGGAIDDLGVASAYSNDTFASNSVTMATLIIDQGGGAIYAEGGLATIASSTFTGNSGGADDGGASIYTDGGATVIVADSILSSGASGTANCALHSGGVVSRGYNLYDDAANSCTLSATGDQHVTGPGLGALADNGGPVQTEAVQAGSPALNAGDPSGCVDAFGHVLATDARGVARPQPAAGRCDIGAYEQAPPTALTGLAGFDAQGRAVLQGTAINPDAVAGTAHFEYGTSTAYGTSTPGQPVGAQSTAAPSATIAGLAPGTYHYRLVVVNPDGAASGPDSTFLVGSGSSKGTAPAVLTGLAKSVKSKTAKLTGQFDGFGLATKWQFQYGTSRKYGKRTKLVSAAAANKVINASAKLKRLKPGKTYHFRLVATNSAGTTKGSDQTFKTKRLRHHHRR